VGSRKKSKEIAGGRGAEALEKSIATKARSKSELRINIVEGASLKNDTRRKRSEDSRRKRKSEERLTSGSWIRKKLLTWQQESNWAKHEKGSRERGYFQLRREHQVLKSSDW
jgi:hypothetical protein